MQKAKDGINSDYQPTEYIQRKALSQLIYKQIEDVYLISKEQREVIIDKFPIPIRSVCRN